MDLRCLAACIYLAVSVQITIIHEALSHEYLGSAVDTRSYSSCGERLCHRRPSWPSFTGHCWVSSDWENTIDFMARRKLLSMEQRTLSKRCLSTCTIFSNSSQRRRLRKKQKRIHENPVPTVTDLQYVRFMFGNLMIQTRMSCCVTVAGACQGAGPLEARLGQDWRQAEKARQFLVAAVTTLAWSKLRCQPQKNCNNIIYYQ